MADQRILDALAEGDSILADATAAQTASVEAVKAKAAADARVSETGQAVGATMGRLVDWRESFNVLIGQIYTPPTPPTQTASARSAQHVRR